MDRVFRCNCARTCSSRSCGSTTRAIRMKAARASASPSRAILRAPTAATSSLATRRLAGCVQRSEFRSDRHCSAKAATRLAADALRSASLPPQLAHHAIDRVDDAPFGFAVLLEDFAHGLAQILECTADRSRERVVVAPDAFFLAKPAAEAGDPFADGGKPLQHRVGKVAMLGEIGAARLGDGIELLAAFG